MEHKIIFTEMAPRPLGPYSQAVVYGGFVFISGQIPIDPETGFPVDGSFEEKVERVILNLKAIVEKAGGSLENIVKVTVYLRDINLFKRFNNVYSKFFPENPPARAVVGVNGLPGNADIEMEAVAYLPGGQD